MKVINYSALACAALVSAQAIAAGPSYRNPAIFADCPDVQFNGEKPWNDLEIRVYPGADGEGELYEDDFETYACEKGAWTRIRFTWNDKARRLRGQGSQHKVLKAR